MTTDSISLNWFNLSAPRRHLLYVGHAYAYVGFVRVWGSR